MLIHYTYIRTNIHTYTHTYIHTYIHIYAHVHASHTRLTPLRSLIYMVIYMAIYMITYMVIYMGSQAYRCGDPMPKSIGTVTRPPPILKILTFFIQYGFIDVPGSGDQKCN